MTQTPQLVLARQQHPLEGRGSHDQPAPGRRLLALGLVGLTLGLVSGLAIGLPCGLAAADGSPRATLRTDPLAGTVAAPPHLPAAGRCPAPNCTGQGGEGLRCSGTATPGGTLQVEVASNDCTVAVTNPVTGETTHHDVGPDKTANVPVPQVPPGTVLRITVGRGSSRRSITVEVTAPAP